MPIVMMASMEDHVQGPLAPALQQVARDAYAARIKRLGIVNAWADPDFKAAVVATGRRQLVMAGVTTDICLVFPTISAVNDGYEVEAVLDASGSSFELQEDMARRRMENAAWCSRRPTPSSPSSR
jgi:nicotinamidase-related amidase